jgi:hypothetical protein
MGERTEGAKYAKGMKDMRYERNASPLNFKGLFHEDKIFGLAD